MRRCRANRATRNGGRSGRCREQPAQWLRSRARRPTMCRCPRERKPTGWLLRVCWPERWSRPIEPTFPSEKESHDAIHSQGSGNFLLQLASCEIIRLRSCWGWIVQHGRSGNGEEEWNPGMAAYHVAKVLVRGSIPASEKRAFDEI